MARCELDLPYMATSARGTFRIWQVLASLPSDELVAPAPGLRDVLTSLRDSGKRLFIVTNSSYWWRAAFLICTT